MAGTPGALARGCVRGRVVRRAERQVGGERDQVAVRLRGVRRLEPLVELVDVEPALARGLAQQLGDPVPVGIGDPQPGPVVVPVELARHADRLDRRR